MQKKSDIIKGFKPGDIVTFKRTKRIRIVLERVVSSAGIELYHIFNPETGVYSAYPEELKYVDHLTEWEDMIGKFEELSISKSAGGMI